jgi:molybdopterin molybdotransferase
MSPALISYDEAAARVRRCAAALLDAPPPPTERVELHQAAGRILAKPLVADRDQPSFPRSTRDGFACRAAEASQHIQLAIAGGTRAGDVPGGPLPPGSAWEIMTGATVPEGADAVMMVEHVEVRAGHVRLLEPRTLKTGENIVPRGAEAREGAELLGPGTPITSAQIALAAFCGTAELDVFVRPRIAILCTGDEIVPVEAELRPGQIRNSNGPMLAALVAAFGGEAELLPTAADTAQALNESITTALETADLLLITGGVSAGKFDLVEPALERFGATFHFTGIRMQPGKPTVFGEVPRPCTNPSQNRDRTKCCFFGLPGNPISSAVTFLLYAAPVLAALAGRRDTLPRFATARLKEDARHASGLTRFLPAKCSFGAGAEWPQVELVQWQGSGDIAAYARSNCFLVLPEDKENFSEGSEVRILLS